MSVGIRELKAHLSEYVHRAQAGENVTITDRGFPVARLAPCSLDALGEDRPEALRRGITEGWIRPGRRRLHAFRGMGARLPEGVTSDRILDDDRGE